MGLFDAFKKKKAEAPLKDLEMPPAPDQQSFFVEQTPIPPQEGEMQFSEQEQMQAPMPDFPLPRQNMPFPSPSANSSFGMPQYDDVPMPDQDEMMQAQAMRSKQISEQIMQQPLQPKMGSPVPTFRFYQEAPEQEEQVNEQMHEGVHSEQREIPFDISQELLSMPEMLKQHQDEQHQEQAPRAFSSFEKIEKKPLSTEQHSHFGKKFITVTALYDIGEQLVNMAEDLGLAKDTAFRLADLNEQEIEMMAKWQTLQHSMELRLAEMDKLMFKA